jgi:hypothetical protein
LSGLSASIALGWRYLEILGVNKAVSGYHSPATARPRFIWLAEDFFEDSFIKYKRDTSDYG